MKEWRIQINFGTRLPKLHFIWSHLGSQVFAIKLLVLRVFLLCSLWTAGIIARGGEARIWEGGSTNKGERVCSYYISCGMASFPNSSFHWVIHEFRRGTVPVCCQVFFLADEWRTFFFFKKCFFFFFFLIQIAAFVYLQLIRFQEIAFIEK